MTTPTPNASATTEPCPRWGTCFSHDCTCHPVTAPTEPAWLGMLRETASNELMADMPCVPIINEGTYRAVYEYIASLLARAQAAEGDNAKWQRVYDLDCTRLKAERDTARALQADADRERWAVVAGEAKLLAALQQAEAERDAARLLVDVIVTIRDLAAAQTTTTGEG